MRTLMVALLVTLLVVPGQAWETDLHYGLTKWLAVKAGFSLEEAEIIASGAQDADEGSVLPAPGLVFHHMCLWHHEAEASRLVQHNHFPSYAPVPDTPVARRVTPGDDSATRWTRMELATAAKGAPHAIALFRFGNSLHPLEDSWSHAGVPDIAVTCDQMLAWGHPKNRGGVLSHDADITYKHVQDTEETAQTVYEYLLEFHKLLGGGTQSASWSSLQPAVHQFAEAATKSDKLAWFESDPAVPYSSYRKCFLNHINIPDGPKYRCPEPARPPLPAAAMLPAPLNDAEQFLRQFLENWIVGGKLDLVTQQIDSEAVLANLGLSEVRNPALLRNMLLTWLNPDHGIANETGHGTRLEFPPVLRDRLEKDLMSFPNLSGAIRASGSDLPYLFSPAPPGADTKAEYIATFQFVTAPRDVVSIGVAHQQALGWRVVFINWVAF